MKLYGKTLTLGCDAPKCGRMEAFHSYSDPEAKTIARKAGWYMRYAGKNHEHAELCPRHTHQAVMSSVEDVLAGRVPPAFEVKP